VEEIGILPFPREKTMTEGQEEADEGKKRE
jgi:hypothetical protein